MMKSLVSVVLLVLTLITSGCASTGALPDARPLQAVSEIDVDRYLGRWYEIARYPMAFENDLVGVTADYTRVDERYIQVVNTGRVKTLDGEVKMAGGRSWVPDASAPGKWVVEYAPPRFVSYWVIAVDSEYRWAIVGEPRRRYLWILSRTPAISTATEAMIHNRLTELGYGVERLRKTPQPPA